jgi:hypothetical protein
LTAPLSKGQRRLTAILHALPQAREQLLVGMDEFGSEFDLARFIAAAESPDARERNKVAVIEREYEVLLNWLHELAARALAEGLRLGVVDKLPGHPWERLAAAGAISSRMAVRLQDAREMRDTLGHAYPLAVWKMLHDGVRALLDDLDSYVDQFERWAIAEGILLQDD